MQGPSQTLSTQSLLHLHGIRLQIANKETQQRQQFALVQQPHLCIKTGQIGSQKKKKKKTYFQIVSFILNISQPLGRHGASLHSSGQPNIVQKLEEFCQGSCSRDGRVGTASQDCPDLRTVFLLTWGPKGGRRLDEGAFPGRGHILQMGYGWKNGVSRSMEGIFATSLMADLKPQWCLSIPRPQL